MIHNRGKEKKKEKVRNLAERCLWYNDASRADYRSAKEGESGVPSTNDRFGGIAVFS